MRRLLLSLCLCLTTFVSALSDKTEQEWLPITQADWQIKEVPYSPDAGAIRLYFSYYKDDNDKFISAYHRIKILSEAGKSYANREIEIRPGEVLKQLTARTIHPDGTIAEFKGKPFEKILFKNRDIKRTARTFTFPDVTVGSIIEYRYTITLPPHVVSGISSWPIQSELFTVKEYLRFRAYQGVVEAPTEWGSSYQHSRVSYAYLHQVDLRVPQKKSGNLMELELDNVPAFESEEYMPPEDDFKPAVYFFYGGRETASPEQFWQEWRKIITEYVEKFIGNFKDVSDAATELTRSETDPEKKLRILYARVQQVRNLSYERGRTQEENKRENLKRNVNVSEVLRHGYGTDDDINRLFVALARAAGFDAAILQVSNREQFSFNKLLLALNQFEDEAVQVKINGRTVVLDPGTRFCPYGLLRWKHASATAMQLTKTGDAFIPTPPPPPGTQKHRTAKLVLAANGQAKGEISVEFGGEEALERRLEALTTDDAGRRKILEDEMQTWLPNGAVATLTHSEGWEQTDEPLIAHFAVEITGFASIAGKRMLVPAFFFPTFQKKMFSSEIRRYPIVVPYPFAEQDEFMIQWPEEYTMEVAPYRRKADLAWAGYEISTSGEGNHLSIKRSLHVDQTNFPVDQYLTLKQFFDIVQRGDEEQAVLQSAGFPAGR